MASQEDEPMLLARLNDGRELSIQPCDCGSCGNEFFVPAISEEWMPNYCPYCGIKFVRRNRGGEPADYKPHSDTELDRTNTHKGA